MATNSSDDKKTSFDTNIDSVIGGGKTHSENPNQSTNIEKEKEAKELNVGRTNRYYDAPINEDTFNSVSLQFACRGNFVSLDKIKDDKCGKVTGWFVPEDKSENPKPHIYNCSHLGCRICGIKVAHKTAKRLAPRYLGFLKSSKWRQIKFGSFNIQPPGEDYKITGEWIKEKRSMISRIAKEAGLTAFSLIFHADRLRDKKDKKGNIIYEKDKKGNIKKDKDGNPIPKQERARSPHFHFIGFGYLMDSNDFYDKYGFTYKQQESINQYNKSELNDLVNRIAYRLNHSAFYKTKSGRASHSIIHYGNISYRKFNIIKEIKNSEFITTDSGSKFVLTKSINKYTNSEIPKTIIERIKKLKKENKLVAKMDENGYPSIELESRINNLENNIYDLELELDENWKNEKIEPVLDFNKNKIFLVEVEKLYRFYNKESNKMVDVSSFELRKDKRPHLYLLSKNYLKWKGTFEKKTDKPTEESIKRVHKRFKELNNQDNNKKGDNYSKLS